MLAYGQMEQTVRKTYKYRLYPNGAQVERLNETLKLCRWLYNACLEQRRQANHLERSTNYRRQSSELPIIKEELPEYGSVYSQVLQSTMHRLDDAFSHFFSRIRERKKGRKVKAGFPRFKSEHTFRSITYPQGGYAINGNHLHVSKIGDLRIKLHRPIEGKIKTLTLKRDKVGDWYAIFSVEMPDVPLKEPESAIGVDVGLIDLITTSENKKIKPRKFHRESESQLKILQRRVSRKVKGSNNRKKAIRRLAKVHRKIERQRDDFLHKVSRTLANQADLVVFERLNIQNMLRNHRLAKSITDASWGKLMKMTAYKESQSGGAVVYVDPNGTSQVCSRCGAWTRISLSERTHVCSNCGFSIDRDLNSSHNILRRVWSDRPEPIQTPVEMLPLLLPSGGGK